MKRKLLSLTLCVVMLLSMLTVCILPASAETYGDLTYSVSDGEVTVTDCNTYVSGKLDIPAEIAGYPVTCIGDWAFKDCTGLTSITIPDSVTTIDWRAFENCTGLTSITIPDSVTSIGDSAFSDCTGLTGITIPDGVTSIGSSAFSGCTGLTSITIPDGVTTIGYSAFCECTELTSITIPDSVTRIGEFAFYECTELTGITIPDSVTSIGDYAFYNCNGLTSITIPDSVTDIGRDAFYGCTGLTSITIPDGVTTIGERAFSGCTGLTSIAIPDGITGISGNAFQNCSSLRTVYLPKSLFWVSNNAFYGCTELTDVYYGSTFTSRIYNIDFNDNNERLQGAEWHYACSNCSYDNDYDATCNNCWKTRSVNPFTDVKEGKFYYDAVLWAVENEVTTGTSATTFSPDNKCTRGQIVTFLWRAAGSPKASTTNTAFTDIKEGSYYYDAVIWAVENGITSGTTATTFSPNSTCTRGQIVTFLWRAKGEQKATISNPFKDTTDGAFYTDAMLWAVENDITTGTSATTFSPNNACTRGQCVTFLYRSFCK